MLIRFRLSNFRSFKDEQELTLVAGTSNENPDVSIPTESSIGGNLLRCVAIYGANASGKTNVIRALGFMREAVLSSQRQWEPGGSIPRQPFLLDDESHTEASLFEVDLLIDDIRYQYGFELDSDIVISEWLFAYPEKRRQIWFTRSYKEGNSKTFQFGKFMSGRNQTIAKLTRDNSLFLSVAAQNNHEQALPIYQWFSALAVVTPEDHFSLQRQMMRYCNDEYIKKLAIDLLKRADLGIVDMDIIEEPFIEQFRRKNNAEVPPERIASILVSNAVFSHRASNATGKFDLFFDDESSGTQALFGLLGPLLLAMSTGKTLLIDELESSLHPSLALWIVGLINDASFNQLGGQVVFNTHDTNLLNSKILRRDQIWFVEKDQMGCSHLYPLWKYKPRKDESLSSGYLLGRYGAIPYLSRIDGFPETQDEEQRG